MTRDITRAHEPVAARRLSNTAELSGELSAGDIVAVGEVPLAVASAGWTLVRGALNESRTSRHGTRPLPMPAAPGSPRPDPTAKERPR